MELTWAIRLRIAIAAAVGIAVIGIYAWPMVAPTDEFGVVSILNSRIGAGDAIVIGAMAFCIGLVCYFLSWPYGSRIGILAVPFGLSVWAARSGNMGTLMQLDTSIVRREEIFSTMCWEPILWLGIVAAGFLGVFVASQIIHPVESISPQTDKPATKTASKSAQPDKSSKRGVGEIVNVIVAIIGSAIIAQLFIGMFARDYTILDVASGAVVAQPANSQIIFAILVAFAISSFIVQKVLKLDYLWSIISSCLVTPFAISTYGKHDVIEYFAGHWPAVFFPNSVLAVLPIQVVSVGTIGAVIGYWIAIRLEYWRQHETGSE
jgi:hypothetical protein